MPWKFLLILLLITNNGFGQTKRPKLVVGIVVDQMRYDYLYKFANRFSEGGFKRLMNGGFNCHNTHFSYIPTLTAPGHASIYTGTTPSVHGIIANDWYNRKEGKYVYCTLDTNYQTVGSNSGAGEMAPSKLLAGTLGDALKLFYSDQAKVISISLKDRGAILPGGFNANGAYWFDGYEGKWITSSYYRKELPSWVSNYNFGGNIGRYLNTDWVTSYDISSYKSIASDSNIYEGKFKGEASSSFPHSIAKYSSQNGNFEILKGSPAGNSMTRDLAIAAIQGEDLGSDEFTDLLAVSFSATDYIGHMFGVNSIEVEDAYLKLDRDLSEMFTQLDQLVGVGEWTLFLTGDHAALEVPQLLLDRNNSGGYFDKDLFEKSLRKFSDKQFGSAGIVENISNNQIFLDADSISAFQLGDEEIQEIVDFVQHFDGVDRVVLSGDVEFYEGNDLYGKLKRGYHPKLSGDLLFTLLPNWMSYSRTGSSHGSGFEYDTHVPCIFYGAGVKKGENFESVNVEDIAPTISSLLRVSWPSATTGTPIRPILE